MGISRDLKRVRILQKKCNYNKMLNEQLFFFFENWGFTKEIYIELKNLLIQVKLYLNYDILTKKLILNSNYFFENISFLYSFFKINNNNKYISKIYGKKNLDLNLYKYKLTCNSMKYDKYIIYDINIILIFLKFLKLKNKDFVLIKVIFFFFHFLLKYGNILSNNKKTTN